MATEVLVPVSTLAGDTNLSGNHLTVDDDPDAPGGDWRTAASNNTNSVAAHGFNAPTGNPNTGAGLQNFKIYSRLTPNASACTYNVYVRENGTRLNGGAAIATGTLTSTTGQLITATWDASLLGTADGSLVECEFEVVKSGGSPSARTSGEVDAIEWNVDYAVAASTTPQAVNATGVGTATYTSALFYTVSSAPSASGSISVTKMSSLIRAISSTAIPTVSKTISLIKEVSILGVLSTVKGFIFTQSATYNAISAISLTAINVLGVTASAIATGALSAIKKIAVSKEYSSLLEADLSRKFFILPLASVISIPSFLEGLVSSVGATVVIVGTGDSAEVFIAAPAAEKVFKTMQEFLWSKPTLTGAYNDRLEQFLAEKGYQEGQVNDSLFAYLRDNGYSGSLPNMQNRAKKIGKWLWQQ